MRLAATDSANFLLCYKRIQIGDPVCSMGEFPLHVLLRPRGEDQYEYIGEVCGPCEPFDDPASASSASGVETFEII